MAVGRISTAQRRARLVVRHGLDGRLPGAAAAVAAVVALHSSDPATPHLSTLARAGGSGPDDLKAGLLDRRDLWRRHAMRRTLFVVAHDEAGLLQAAVGRDVAARQRRRLERSLAQARVDDRTLGELAEVEQATLAALADGRERTTAEVVAAVPALSSRLDVGSGRFRSRVSLGSRVLQLLAFDGAVTRTRATGTFRAGQYRWARSDRWFPQPAPPEPDPATARTELVQRYLATHGPATLDDVAWWSGLTRTRTRAALVELGAVEVALDDGRTGHVLAEDTTGPSAAGIRRTSAAVALLPALDPSPMGFTHRGWFLGPHGPALFDRNGNVGPTVWLGGRIVGGWGQAPDGRVLTRLLEDVDAAAARRIGHRAAELATWLDGTVVVPRFRTPLERALADGR